MSHQGEGTLIRRPLYDPLNCPDTPKGHSRKRLTVRLMKTLKPLEIERSLERSRAFENIIGEDHDYSGDYKYAEETVLKVAHAYEQNTPWHTMRPPNA